jgi:hypothetical protein
VFFVFILTHTLFLSNSQSTKDRCSFAREIQWWPVLLSTAVLLAAGGVAAYGEYSCYRRWAALLPMVSGLNWIGLPLNGMIGSCASTLHTKVFLVLT